MRFRGIASALCGSVLLLLAGCGSQEAAAPITVTVPTTVPKTVPVTATITLTSAVPTTVATTVPTTVTVTAAPTANASDPSAPKANGNYLVNKQIAPGNWQCSSGDDSTFWRISDSGANTINNGFSTIASIDASAFTADLSRCNGTWSLVG
jgi:hypothetical protein